MFLHVILDIMLSIFLTYILLILFSNLFKSNNLLFKNYKLKEIPSCMGIVFVICQTITLIINLQMIDNIYFFVFYYLIGLLFIAIISLLDDLIDDQKVKGFKGHLLILFNGYVTTGVLKAVSGFICSFFISFLSSKNLYEIILNTCIIVLFINFINLMDLRPGRAIKIVLISIIFLILNQTDKNSVFISISTLGFIIVYLPKDLKGNMMLGDIGSNTLGWTLGVLVILNLNFIVKMIVLIILLTIHIIAEKYSLSELIKKNKILNYLDNLGR